MTNTVHAPRAVLRVEYFDTWHPVLDDALKTLPEIPTCPHDLFRQIASNPASTEKRLALVSDGGKPVAVAALRRRQRHWEPVGYGVTHDAVMPAKEGYLYPALAALKLDVWVVAAETFPIHDAVRQTFPTPRYAMSTKADFDEYWHGSGLWGIVKYSRRRTRNYRLEVDRADAADWTIRRWAERWQGDPSEETIVIEDLLTAAKYLFDHGRYHTFRLFDGDRPVAGHNFLVYGRSIVFQTTFFDTAYRKDGVGSRLLDLVFHWARDVGFEKIDLGGGHTYKSDWAPQDGNLWNYNVCPENLHRMKQATRLVANAVHHTKALSRGLVSRRGSVSP